MISCSVAGGEVGYRGAKKRLLQRLFLFPTGIYCRRESVQGTELFLDKNNFLGQFLGEKERVVMQACLPLPYCALHTADGPANCPSVKIDWSRGPVLLFTHTHEEERDGLLLLFWPQSPPFLHSCGGQTSFRRTGEGGGGGRRMRGTQVAYVHTFTPFLSPA